MSPTVLSIALLGAMLGLAVVLNHCHARVALVELALNEGLPPGHRPLLDRTSSHTDATVTAELLGPGVHLFLSRTCHACQRLIEELDDQELPIAAPLHIRYVDRPRPIATSAAQRQNARLDANQVELAERVGADPLPYTVAVGELGSVQTAVTPTLAQLRAAALDVGIRA